MTNHLGAAFFREPEPRKFVFFSPLASLYIRQNGLAARKKITTPPIWGSDVVSPGGDRVFLVCIAFRASGEPLSEASGRQMLQVGGGPGEVSLGALWSASFSSQFVLGGQKLQLKGRNLQSTVG